MLDGSCYTFLNANQVHNPRPGFPLAPGQRFASSLLLDKNLGIKIPGAINTYLRDYQRKGVEFLWRQYNQGHGGLLGDDMGLVRIPSFFRRVSHFHRLVSPIIRVSYVPYYAG